MGKTLGSLHNLSKEYSNPQYNRMSYMEQMKWMKETLQNYNNQQKAFKEIELLEGVFKQLEKTKENYGLIHFDFETDNVFYNSGTFTPIDFDDSSHHWYIMDIERSLHSLKEEVPESYEELSKSFIKGYRSKKDISNEMFDLIPVFRRYANLYGYVRVIRSLDQEYDNEPEWMVSLRKHLNQLIKLRMKEFGKPTESVIILGR